MSIKITPRMLYDLSNVKRWSAIRTIKQQSVAEHVFGVMVACHWLSEYLAAQEPDANFGVVGKGYDVASMHGVYLLALFHDGVESVSGGDQPTPFKDVYSVGMRDLEKWSVDDTVGPFDPVVEFHVKVADQLEALAFLAFEDAMGNKTVQPIVTNIEDRLEAMGVGRGLINSWYAEISPRLFPIMNFEKAEDNLPDMGDSDIPF
jgi:hypothetical protein